MVLVRNAEPSDLDALTGIWYLGWRDAHLAIVPAALARLRTREQFRDRLSKALSRVRVADLAGTPIGFAMLRQDEVYQFYLAADARGTGAALILMRDAEAQLASDGTATAWLSCAIGNARAARFYEKAGWVKVRTMVDHTETTEGPFALETWRFEKRLPADQAR
jgi:ribosomal protein S18 acetylase RimI-like enzyme